MHENAVIKKAITLYANSKNKLKSALIFMAWPPHTRSFDIMHVRKFEQLKEIPYLLLSFRWYPKKNYILPESLGLLRASLSVSRGPWSSALGLRTCWAEPSDRLIAPSHHLCLCLDQGEWLPTLSLTLEPSLQFRSTEHHLQLWSVCFCPVFLV